MPFASDFLNDDQPSWFLKPTKVLRSNERSTDRMNSYKILIKNAYIKIGTTWMRVHTLIGISVFGNWKFLKASHLGQRDIFHFGQVYNKSDVLAKTFQRNNFSWVFCKNWIATKGTEKKLAEISLAEMPLLLEILFEMSLADKLLI